MPQTLEQGVVGRAVVDGQVQGDGGDLQPGHEALVIGLEDVGVLQGAVLARAGTGGDVVVGLQDRPGRERVVVGVRLLDLGVEAKEVNVGGMTFKQGTKALSQAVYISDEDAKAFQEIDKRGITQYIQQVPSTGRSDLMEALKSKGFIS